MSAPQTLPDLPDRCELQHHVFSSLGDVRFRLSATDGVPMMAVQMGEREAQLPLEALRREFSIGNDSADGRMLDLIGSALDYVSSLQPGDRLPAEIRTGEASWKPSAKHLRIASARLQVDLCAWMRPNSRWAKMERDVPALLSAADDPGLREDVHAISTHAAVLLAMREGGDLIRLLDDLSRELAYIEALRDRLRDRVVGLCSRVGELVRDRKRPAVSFDTLAQVHRLLTIGAKQITSRFDELALHAGEVDELLRNVESQRSFIRSNRDWLYRAQRAWEPVLDRWTHEAGADLGALLATTYQFLAPRFMPTTAWQRPGSDRNRGAVPARMSW